MTARRSDCRVRLPHDETDESRRYSLPDPDALACGYSAVYRHRYYREAAPTREQIAAVLALAEGYLGLTMEHGQERAVRKLRDLWRFRRARQAANAAEERQRAMRDQDADLDRSGL